MNILFDMKKLNDFQLDFLSILVNGSGEDDPFSLKVACPELAQELTRLIRLEIEGRELDHAASGWKMSLQMQAPASVILERQRLIWHWLARGVVFCEMRDDLHSLGEFLEKFAEQISRAIFTTWKARNRERDFISRDDVIKVFDELLNELREEVNS